MKILYLITKSEAGGAQTHIAQLTRHMVGNGHVVYVMAYPGGWLEKEIETIGGTFISNAYFRNSFNPFFGLQAMRVIKKVVNEVKPDIVSCHSSSAGVWGRLSIRNRIPTLFTAHGWAFTDGAPLLRRIIAIIVEKIIACYARKIICVSEYDRSLALRYSIAQEKKFLTIHNGVEIEQNQKYAVSQKSGVLRIVSIGRLAPPKDHELLIHAFHQLPKTIQDHVTITIIGGGQKREHIQSCIYRYQLQDKIILAGELSREDTLDQLKNGDIFVLLSQYEGFPRSLLEAMSVSLPVIASSVGGVPEIVTGDVGITVPRGGVQEVTRALERLITDRTLCRSMGESAHRRVKAYFSLDRMIEQTVQVYEKILDPMTNG